MAGTPEGAEKVAAAMCLWPGTAGCPPHLRSSWVRFLVLSPLLPRGEVLPGLQLLACSAPGSRVGLVSGKREPAKLISCPGGAGSWLHALRVGWYEDCSSIPALLGWGQHKRLSKRRFSRAQESQELQDRRGRILPSCIHPLQEQSPVVQTPHSSAPK